MAWRWYQTIEAGVPDVVYEDPNRKISKFWNEGKWDNFIKPLMPEEREVFLEVGSNAGLFLKMAKDIGFNRVVGVESSGRIMWQAEQYRKYNGLDYKLMRGTVGSDISVDDLPMCDVVLIANTHYYIPLQDWIKIVDRLRFKTQYVIIVSAPVRKKDCATSPLIEDVRSYFKEWEEVKSVENIDITGDPSPREGMFSILFKSPLEKADIVTICERWRTNSAGSQQYRFANLWKAQEDFMHRIINKEEFDVSKCFYFEYHMTRRPFLNSRALARMLEAKRVMLKDMMENGIREPIYFNKNWDLLDGGHRMNFAVELGLKYLYARRF